LREGSDPKNVALLLSLSGKIAIDALPPDIDASFAVYELILGSEAPNTMFLNTRADLDAFRIAYQGLLSEITAQHPGLATVHCLPAIPVPVAVMCGHDLLNKSHPSLRVYDHDKANGGFTYQLTVNSL
jgi:hypothetical protein